MGSNAFEWLESVRGLSAERCQDLGIRSARHPQHGDGIAVPFRNLGGGVVGEMFRSPSGAVAWNVGGVPGVLFGIDDVANEALSSLPVVLCQDPLDALAVMDAGFRRACATPGGWYAETQEPVIRAIVHGIRALKDSPCVIVAAAADESGETFTRAMAATLDPHPVRFVRLPEGCHTPSDVLARLGSQALAACLNAAELLEPPTGLITGFSDLPPLSERRILRPGLDKICNAVAFEQQAMSVCTGIPGHGKSTFMRFVAHHTALNENIRVGAMEFEGNPRKMRDHLSRLIIGRDFADLPKVRQDEVAETLDAHWRVVHRPTGSESPAENLEWLHDRIRALTTLQGCKLIYVDPWNELEHLPEPGESLTNYINHATKCIRQWAERYDAHICVVAHPKKITDGRSPDGYDVADSAAWANKPALGFTIHQEPEDRDEGLPAHISLRTWKVRDVEAYGFGRGMLRLDFDPARMSYAPLYKPSRSFGS